MCSPVPKNTEILDFGAGYKATQSQILSIKYPKIKAYDFPETMEDSVNDAPELKKIFTQSPQGNYDIILASNVLNVQKNLSMLQNTLNEIYCGMKKGSSLIMNIPKDPIKFIPKNTSCRQKNKQVATHGVLKNAIKKELEKRFGEKNIHKIKRICGKKTKTALFRADKKSKEKENIFCNI